MLDAAVFLLSAALALFFWDVSARIADTVALWLAIRFGVTADTPMRRSSPAPSLSGSRTRSGRSESMEEDADLAGQRRTLLVTKGPIKDPSGNITGVFGAGRDITARKRAEEEQQILLRELQAALLEVKTLRGLVTVCANCRRIRNDAGTWQQMESYVREHSQAEFSHGLCPDCARQWEGRS
jgi:PAS domain-containing protein